MYDQFGIFAKSCNRRQAVKVVHRSQNLLILQERPVLLWILAGVYILLGFFLIPYLTQNQDDKFWGILFCGIFIAGGFLTIYATPFATYRFDKTLRSFILKRKRLSGTKIVEHPLNEIKDVQVEESIDSDGSTYRVSIVLVSGDRLPLTDYYDSFETNKQKTASCIKSFLNI